MPHGRKKWIFKQGLFLLHYPVEEHYLNNQALCIAKLLGKMLRLPRDSRGSKPSGTRHILAVNTGHKVSSYEMKSVELCYPTGVRDQKYVSPSFSTFNIAMASN